MSNELIINNPESALAFLAELREDTSDVDAQSFAELDPQKLLPSMRLPREGTTFSITVAGEPLPSFTSRKYVDVLIVGLAGARALFPPQGQEDNSKLPVCSTGLQSIPSLRTDATYGERRLSDGTTEQVACRGCEWNQFNSAAQWDETKSKSRSKACGERRVLALLVMTKGAQIPLADEQVQLFLYGHQAQPELADPQINQHGVVLCRFSYGSNAKLLGEMEEVARTRNVPLSRCVWRLSVEEQTKGATKWTTFKAIHVGVVDPPTFRSGLLRSAEQWWFDYVEKYGRATEIDAATTEKTEEEIGF